MLPISRQLDYVVWFTLHWTTVQLGFYCASLPSSPYVSLAWPVASVAIASSAEASPVATEAAFAVVAIYV